VKAGNDYIITIEAEEVFRTANEKRALTKFHAIRRSMEEEYPATELTKEQKQEALKRLIGDSVLREVRNSTRKSKFDNLTKQGRFDNR
jgi:hypothetical protein